jgi:hypothetical protein
MINHNLKHVEVEIKRIDKYVLFSTPEKTRILEVPIGWAKKEYNGKKDQEIANSIYKTLVELGVEEKYGTIKLMAKIVEVLKND